MAVVRACYGINLSVIVQYWTKVITLIYDAENPNSLHRLLCMWFAEGSYAPFNTLACVAYC